jgi:hypothetical protein
MYHPPYLKILHFIDQTIVFVFQHFYSLCIYLQSRIMSSTSLSEDCAVCGKSFKRLGAHLARSLASGSYYMPRGACEPETRGDCPRFRKDIAVGNVRFPVSPLFCSTALLPRPFLRPPTRLRRLGDMVWPSPAAWQVRSAQRHSGQQHRNDDQARRGDNPAPDH